MEEVLQGRGDPECNHCAARRFGEIYDHGVVKLPVSVGGLMGVKVGGWNLGGGMRQKGGCHGCGGGLFLSEDVFHFPFHRLTNGITFCGGVILGGGIEGVCDEGCYI